MKLLLIATFIVTAIFLAGCDDPDARMAKLEEHYKDKITELEQDCGDALQKAGGLERKIATMERNQDRYETAVAEFRDAYDQVDDRVQQLSIALKNLHRNDLIELHTSFAALNAAEQTASASKLRLMETELRLSQPTPSLSAVPK